MKKVLLTTTAISLVAGVAAAEITFSGSGEAGFYRNAPAAATAGTAGRNASSTGANSTTDAYDKVFYSSGVLTVTAAEKLASTNKQGPVPTATEIAIVESQILGAKSAAAAHQADADAHLIASTDATGISSYVIDKDLATADLAEAARLEAQLAVMKGVAATAKGATPKMSSYSGYDLNVAASGASDNGMTFAMAFDMGAGLIADQDDDRAMDAQAGTIDTSGLTIGYAGYTIVIGDEKVDDQYDADGWNADVSISGSLGDLTFTVATDMDDDVKAVAGSTVYTQNTGAPTTFADVDTLVVTAASAAVYNPTSYSLGYTMGDATFTMAGTEHDEFGNAAAKMSLTYKVSDALSATVSSDNVGTYKDIGKLSATYKLSDMLSITASVKDDKDHALNTNTGKKQSQDASIAYAAGSMTATLATDESSNWWVNAKYDLGGGASAFTTFDHTEFLVAGVNFKF